MRNDSVPVIDTVTLDELEADPYPILERWRRETPVAYYPPLAGWVVSRWEECEAIGRLDDSTDLYNDFLSDYFGEPNITSLVPADHAFLRAAVDRPLRPKAVNAYIEQLARPVAVKLVDEIRSRGRADATRDILELASVRVVGDVLGMGDVDTETLQRWFLELSLGLTNLEGDVDIADISSRAMAEVDEYVRITHARLLRDPDESGFSHMIHSDTPDGVPRTFDELISSIRIIVLGALQEPGHALAATLLGLLENPDQLQATIDDRSLAPTAVHEGLRWIAPFGTASRRALVDIPVGDLVIPAGDEIHLVISSANRDERRYDHPERFDIFRPRVPVASFGYGRHFCAGHYLSPELEKIVLEEVITRLPGLRLDPERPPVVTGFTVRGVKSLPVVWDVAPTDPYEESRS